MLAPVKCPKVGMKWMAGDFVFVLVVLCITISVTLGVESESAVGIRLALLLFNKIRRNRLAQGSKLVKKPASKRTNWPITQLKKIVATSSKGLWEALRSRII